MKNVLRFAEILGDQGAGDLKQGAGSAGTAQEGEGQVVGAEILGEFGEGGAADGSGPEGAGDPSHEVDGEASPEGIAADAMGIVGLGG